MNLRRFSLLAIVAVLFACSRVPEHVKHGHRLIAEISASMENNHGYILSGSGGAMMHDIKELAVRYEGTEQLSVSKARKLFVTFMEEALAHINEDVAARPYLHSYPFTRDNIDCMISVNNDSGEYVNLILCVNDTLSYLSRQGPEHRSTKLHNESYEDARRIVMGE